MKMKNREKPARETLSRLQCVCALMGLIVTAAAIAVLARSAFADHRPPDLTVLPQALRPVGAGWALEVKVVNNGDMTAAAVEIEGEADGEKSGATLDYVPGHGEKRATLVFSSDGKPQAQVRITGWSDP
ncbi:hypothetical protein ACQKKG_03195 [Brevundimonas sp. NPDC003935]|nr:MULTISPECIES: hypothetical protein [unclassified Brevundimonas]